MAVMEKVHEQVDSEYDGARFPQERTAGLVLGLTLEQIIVIGVGVICGLVGIIGQGRMLVLGLLGFVLLGVFGAVRVHGRSGPAWAWTVLRYLVRSATGQATYKQELTAQEVILVDGEPVRPVQEATTVAERDAKGKIRPGKPVRFNLPGMSDEMLVYALPNGAGMAWEPRRREAVVCAKVMTTRGFDLESHDAKEERSLSWGATLAAAATVGGVCRIQASDQTTLISGADVRAFYQGKQEQAGITGADIDPFLDTAFRELMKEAQDMPVHEQWLTLVVSADQIGSQLKQLGGGIPAMMEHVLKVMATIEGLLPRSGTRVTSWHSPRSLAGLCRSAFDPDAAQMVTETDSQGMAVGASPAQAGPVGMEAYPGHLFTDGYLHRTFKVAELPQRLARLGFLDELVFAGDFRHTVSVYMAPRDRGAAMRDTKQRWASWETDTKLMAKLGRPPSPEHMQELEDIEREQDELMARHASLKVLVLVTVSGRTESELASATSQMVTAAATAECQLRTLWTEQDGAFIGAALPFGQVKM